MSDRAAITGIGVVSPVGSDRKTFLQSLLAGRGGIRRIPRYEDSPYRVRHAGEITDFPPGDRSTESDFASLDRHLQLALVAAEQALGDAGLERTSLGDRVGLVFGTCNGGMLSIEQHYRALHGLAGGRQLDADLSFAKRYFSGATTLAHRFGIRGPCCSVVTACAASGNAIGLGRDWLLEDRVDVVLVGGADALSDTTLAGFDRLLTTSAEPCAPFSEPVGLNLGEGAGFWIMEREAAAHARGARIHGFALGYGLSNDAHHATAPDPSGEGLALAIQRALDDAGVTLDSIGYVNAHGTGTEANDRAESRVLERLFGGPEAAPPVSSTKSFFGHTLGAAGILEATAALLCLGEGRALPPTLQFGKSRAGCHLDFVPNQARPAQTTRLLTQNAAFGGNNCALILGTAADPAPDRTAPDSALRVALTGIGLISAVGAGTERLCQALERGESGIREVQRFEVEDCKSRLAALVEDLGDPRAERRLGLQGMDRCSRYATVAAHRALARSGIKLRPRLAKEIGLLVGLTLGPTRGEMEYLRSLYAEGVPNLVHFPYLVLNSVAGNVSRALLLKGSSSTLCSGPGSGLESLNQAFSAVRLGHARTLLAGGVDEVTERVFRDHDEIDGLDDRSEERIVLGEGGAMALLEPLGQAEQRKAEILAEVLAASSGFDPDGFRTKNRKPDTLDRFIENLLEASRVAVDEVQAVCLGARLAGCHEAEDQALDRVLGHERNVPRERSDAAAGAALATAPLFSLARALATVERGAILALSASPYGEHHGLVLWRGARER